MRGIWVGAWWKLLALLVAAGLMVFAVGCGPAPDDDDDDIVAPDEPLPELKLAIGAEIQGTDPQQVTTTVEWVHGFIGTPPVDMGLENDQILPYGAKEVEVSEDGLEIRLTFDPSRTFHNGVPVTAEAVKKSIERYLEISPYAFDYDPVEEMEVDGDTLVFTLNESGPALMVVLSSYYAAPIEVGAAEEMGEDQFHRETVGEGPYKVGEWVDGSHIILERFEDYQDYLPFVGSNAAFNFETINVRFIPEAFTRVSELRAGNVDMISGVPSELLGTLEDDPDVVLHEYLNPNTRHIQMNTERFPFDDQRVRLAINYAIDRDEIAANLDHTIQPQYGLVAPAMISHDPATESQLSQEFAHNLERAKELLAEAGWEDTTGDGFLDKDGQTLSFEFVFANDVAADQKAGPLVQAQLERVGIQAELREYESRYLRELIGDSDFDMILRNWSWLDPGGVWPAGLHSEGSLAPWSHPDVDALIDAAVVVPDPDERAQKWGELSVRVWDDVPLFAMWSDRLYLAARSDLEGFLMNVSGTNYFHDVTLDRD